MRAIISTNSQKLNHIQYSVPTADNNRYFVLNERREFTIRPYWRKRGRERAPRERGVEKRSMYGRKRLDFVVVEGSECYLGNSEFCWEKSGEIVESLTDSRVSDSH